MAFAAYVGTDDIEPECLFSRGPAGGKRPIADIENDGKQTFSAPLFAFAFCESHNWLGYTRRRWSHPILSLFVKHKTMTLVTSKIVKPLPGTMEEKAFRAWRAKEYQAAIELYENLALNGSKTARSALYSIYLVSDPEIRNPNMSKYWAMKILEDAWDADASLVLGHLYYSGDLGEANFEEAYKIYKTFEDRELNDIDFARGLFRLGVMCELGLGIEKNLDRAEILYLRASRLGSIQAKKNLGVLRLKRGQLLRGYWIWAEAIAGGWLLVFTSPKSHRLLP